MPRQQKVSVQNSFIKGLVTESTALQFPQDACTETFNCVFDETGRVTRRPGFDAESPDFTTTIANVATDAYTEFVWNPVAGSGSRTFVIQQKGEILHFYDISTDTTLAGNKLPFTIDLTTAGYQPAGAPTPNSFPCQYAAGRGALVVVNAAVKPLLVQYDSVGNVLTITPQSLTQRDFVGVDDGLAINTRPAIDTTALAASNPAHLYNLINQGWYVGGENTNGMADAADILAQWSVARDDSPSNSDIPSLYRDVSTVSGGMLPGQSDVFNPNYVAGINTGNTQAARGHFILDVFSPDREGAMLAEGYTVDLVTPPATAARPATTAFFVGRTFYSGIDATTHASNIYFTQIIERDDQYSQCYQKNDPTNEHFTDLLPDDGGVIRIPEAGLIKKLFAYQTSLLVFATNGVWGVSGSSQDAFQANDFQIRKLSSVGTNSPLSFADVRGAPYWWGEDGIYTLSFDSVNNSFSVVSISDQSIKTLFDSIPLANRQYVKGSYCIEETSIHWIFNDDSLTASNHYVYQNELVYNVLTKSWSPWTISTDGPILKGIFYAVDGARQDKAVIKYTIIGKPVAAEPTKLAFAETNNLNWFDWQQWGTPTDYLSYFIAGYQYPGETQRYGQNNYVYVFLEQETNASCFVRGVYDFAINANTGKWSTAQQVYNSTHPNRSVRVRRLKVRGKGRALQMRFESETGKPFTIIGWSVWNTTNAAA